MIRESGVVIEVKDGAATILVDAADASQCRSCGICSAAGRKHVLSDVPAPEGLKAGDRVTAEVSLPSPAKSAAVLFLVPMVVFIGTLVAAEQLRAQDLLPGGSGISVLIAFALTALWYVGVAIFDRKLRRSPERRPKIIAWPGQTA